MWVRGAALGVVALALGSFAFAEDKPELAEDASPWTEFRSVERGFAVEFPGTPKTASAQVEGQNPLLQYDYQVSVGEDTVYSVVVFEYPEGKGPEPDAAAFVKLVSAYAKGSDSRLRKRGPATIAGRAGFEAISDESKTKLSHLISVVPAGDRIYMLVTAGPRGHATGKDAARFRDSFRLLEDESEDKEGSPAQSAATPAD
jgi:hypothetical protein